MTKTATKEKQKVNDRLIVVFPLEFSEGQAKAGDSPAIPDTIHLIPIGQWEHDLYGPILITNADIREFAQNFNAGIRKGVPITAGHEGFEELPAVGWITKVEVRDDGLWGEVDWNKLGTGILTDRQFKFFSPEFYRDYEDPQTHQIYRNVIVGGALTKSPYFKELEAVVFSDKTIKKFNETTMDLQAILAKDITTLTDEEKAFVKEHASELTEEQKTSHTAILEEATTETEEEKTARETKEAADKTAADEEKAKGDANEAAGLNRDGSEKTAEQIQASDKKIVQISASELQILRNKADEGAKAFAEIAKGKLEASVKALTFNENNKAGKFLPKSADNLRKFMETLNEAQRATFSELVAQIPASQIFTEKGESGHAVEGTATAEIEAKVAKKMSENKDMKYSEALKLVMSENKGLEERFDTELVPVSKARKQQA